jgi:GTP cyclohydrolase II
VLLYLRQEGRGIGLANKLRAYALQDRGLDTVDANRRLGFADDERDYGMAAAMLRGLGIDRLRLLTNNPSKVAGLEREGIAVEARIAHHMPTNPHNADYIATKQSRSGHLA